MSGLDPGFLERAMGIEPMSEAWENCCFKFQIEYRCDYQTLCGTGMRSDHRRSGLRTSETLGGEGTPIRLTFALETFLRRIPTQPEISEILAKVPEFCSRSENSVRNYQIHEELQRKANKVKQQLAKRR